MEEYDAKWQGLLMKCLRNEASEEEQLEAYQWINASIDNKKFYESLKEYWIAACLHKPFNHDQGKRAWRKVSQAIEHTQGRDAEIVMEPQQVNRPAPGTATAEQIRKPANKVAREKPSDVFRLIPLHWSRMAAAVLIAFVMGTIATGIYLDINRHETAHDDFFTIEAPRGAKSTITMIDGSKVFLNAGSQIRYPRTYNQENRDIFLEGEGYFVVAKNEHIPFKVHTSGITVQALGTEFNVKAYPEDDRVETTLIKGSVSIARNGVTDQSQSIVLKPNQKASVYFDRLEINEVAYTNDTKPAGQLPSISRPVRVRTESNINPETATSWKETRWVFDRESMESLAEKLERQYDINITFRDLELKQYYLTGTLEEESIEQVLKALQLALPVDFQIKHKDVILSINHQRKNSYKHLLKE